MTAAMHWSELPGKCTSIVALKGQKQLTAAPSTGLHHPMMIVKFIKYFIYWFSMMMVK